MKKLTTEEFIKRATCAHGDRYDYSKVEYKNRRTKVCIICPTHGEFYQGPYEHINGQGCPKCSKEYVNELQREKANDAGKNFEEKSRQVHGNKYDYSMVEYVNALTKVEIICPIHGVFKMRPNDHLNGYGCPKCGYESFGKSLRLGKDEFIRRAKKIHGNKYDYSKVEYVNNNTKVCIVCSEHGEFWQTPVHHLSGQGCPKCSESSLEEKVRLMLVEYNIKFDQHKKFGWLGKQHLDFYLPDYKIGIECQGIQHYKPVDFAGKGKEWALNLFEDNKRRDKLKKELCEANGVKIVYFNYNDKIIKLKSRIL